MTPEVAAAEVRRAAEGFGAGVATITDMWSSFHGCLFDLCQNEPLSGDFLWLFFDREAWEMAVGEDRSSAVERARATARRLAGST